jgi:hypothetical protein
MTNEELAKALMIIFQGMENGHGAYNPQVTDSKGKLVGHAEFIHEPATFTTWLNHIDGTYGIGIGPINNSSMCHWGAIDIDDYSISHLDLIKKIETKKLPLIVVKSKSGGAHLMMFLTEWTPAGLVKDRLTEMAASLGHAFDKNGKATEVFPRQTQILSDRGDCGNWLNIPYFGANNSSRYALDSKAEKLTIEEFLALVYKTRISEKELANIQIGAPIKSTEFKDAPFCLSLIIEEGGISEGNRNSFMYNMGILACKTYPNNKDLRNVTIEDWNVRYCSPSLPASEICDIQQSLDKHPDYKYQCKDPLLKAYCNVAVCRSKKHGLSGACLMPACSDLLKLNSNPSIYFLQVNETRVEFPSTEDLINQNKFNTHCVEQANVMPPTMKKQDWTELVNSWLQDMRIIEAPLDASIDAKLEELLETFAEQMNTGFGDRQDIARNLPWFDSDSGKVIFRLSGLENFLLSNKFSKLNRGQLSSKLKTWGADSKQMKIGGRNYNVWQIKLDNVTNTAYEVKLMTEKDIL